MGNHDTKYSLYNQEDIFEFFNQYLPYLNGELDKYYGDYKSLYFSNYQVNMTKASSKNLYFNELFHNIQRTAIKCSNCLTEEYCLNSQFNLIYTQLTPNQNPLLNWKCSNCSSNYAKKTDSFEQLPQYLVINLNRFKSGGVQSLKNTEFIRYSTELELKCNETPVRYKLYAVCNHFGDLGGGHYTSACRNPLNGKWYNFNDIHVNLVSEANVENRNTSLSFFEKQTNNNWKFNFNNHRNMKANLY